MWKQVDSPETYIEGGCSFCKLAKEDCNICKLPKYFCEKENGNLKRDTLISRIRSIRKFLLDFESGEISYRFHTGKVFLYYIFFQDYLELIKRGVKDMMYFGKVRKKTIKRILEVL